MPNQKSLWTFIKVRLVLTGICHLILGSHGLGEQVGRSLYRMTAG